LATNYVVLAPRVATQAKELLALARQSAGLALELKPNLARAYGAMGTLARHELRWKAAIENFSKAVALDPADSITLISLATTYSMMGKFEQGKALGDEAARIDPIYNFRLAPVHLTFASDRRDDRAVTEIATKLTRAQGDLRGLGFGTLALLARERGDITEAEKNFRAGAQAYGRSASLVDAVVRAMRSRAAVEQARRAIREEGANDPTFEPEGTFLVLGDYTGFFDALDARLERGRTAGFWVWMSFAWRLASGDDDASRRFKMLARKIGLVDYWKESGWPDRCRPKGKDDFECS
jgi:tetratricopeptide (TPR) repeat protein